VAGTLTLVYDHRVRLLEEKMTGLQHDHNRVILSKLHVHLSWPSLPPLTGTESRATGPGSRRAV
jgi:hypothetical protein